MYVGYKYTYAARVNICYFKVIQGEELTCNVLLKYI